MLFLTNPVIFKYHIKKFVVYPRVIQQLIISHVMSSPNP